MRRINTGKKTAGIDGKAFLTYVKRINLSLWLKNHYNNWYHQGLREIPISKKDRKTRILKVPDSTQSWQYYWYTETLGIRWLKKFSIASSLNSTVQSELRGFSLAVYDTEERFLSIFCHTPLGNPGYVK